jgi:hypothetical protein
MSLSISFTRRRTGALVAALGLIAALTAVAGPAKAASCTTLPVSTTGADVRVAGEDRRVPAITDVTICVGDAAVPFVWTATSGGSCVTGCLSVGLRGSDVDSGGITISYRADGQTTSQSIDPGGLGGPSDTCLLSVGGPDAPHPDCFVALGVDDLPSAGPLVDQARQTVQDLVDSLPDDPVGDLDQTIEDLVDDLPGSDTCESVPPARDEWGNTVEFCDDPAQWTGITVTRVCERYCGDDGLDNLMVIVCRLLHNQGIAECA